MDAAGMNIRVKFWNKYDFITCISQTIYYEEVETKSTEPSTGHKKNWIRPDTMLLFFHRNKAVLSDT